MALPGFVTTALGADIYLIRGPQANEADALREILSSYAQLPIDAIVFDRSSRGKPTLSPPYAGSVWFNLSRAGSHTLVAVSALGEVGIDIEDSARPLDLEALERRALSPSERSTLAKWPQAAHSRMLVQYWCRKEAVLKAAGLGLSIEPDLVEVHSPLERATGISLLPVPTGNLPMSWHDIDLRGIDPDLVATLAAPAAGSIPDATFVDEP